MRINSVHVFSKELLLRLPDMLRERTRELNQGQIRQGGFVLYWMRTAVRAHENPALDTAIEAANLLGVPVFVYHGISERYPQASDRHHQFMLEGARDVQEELGKRGIGYLCHVERTGDKGAHLKLLVGMSVLMVTENMPTPQLQRWVASLRKTYRTVQWLVDTNCIVPMNLSRRRYDDPEEFLLELRSARHRRLGLPWLDVESEQGKFIPTIPFSGVEINKSNIATLIEACDIDHCVVACTLEGGAKQGYRLWRRFGQTKLRNYHSLPRVAALGGLLPYLQYGHISPFTLARDAQGAGPGGNAFLRELLVDREFALHHCMRNLHPTLPELPDNSGAVNQYSWAQLDCAQTDDERWNSYQCHLVQSGNLPPIWQKYWLSNIVKWSAKDHGWFTAKSLFQKYALNGFDPSSVVGLIRSVGGLGGGVASATTAVTEANSSYAPTKVAIIGSGIAAQSCARVLQQMGVDVQLFKSTEETKPKPLFDSFSVCNSRFRLQAQQWITEGLISEETVPSGEFRQGHFIETSMESLLVYDARLQQSLASHSPVGIVQKVSWKQQWTITASDGRSHAGFDEVVIALPLDELEVLPSFLLEKEIAAAKQEMTTSLCAEVHCTPPLELEWSSVNVADTIIATIHQKEGVLLVECSSDWSVDDEVVDRESFICAAVQELLQTDRHCTVHRWTTIIRTDQPVLQDCIRNSSRRLSFCGDYFQHGGLEASWLSGISCASRMFLRR
jgi:predicted NAD/FAD-dependent oxidoreductase/deoxyribodipyrimidine photolyase